MLRDDAIKAKLIRPTKEDLQKERDTLKKAGKLENKIIPKKEKK